MAKPNYSFEKRQRELAKKKKQEQKRQKKAAGGPTTPLARTRRLRERPRRNAARGLRYPFAGHPRCIGDWLYRSCRKFSTPACPRY